MRRHLLVFLVFALLLAQAVATTVKPLSVEELTAKSSDVVVARAASSYSQWNPERTRIYTYTRFQVTRGLKGSVVSEVTVKQLGGSAEGYTQKVAGVRHWKTGEQAVLFLKPSASADGTMIVTGLFQGSFAVRRDSAGELVVSNGVSDATQYDPKRGSVRPYRGAQLKLSELEARVTRAAGRR